MIQPGIELSSPEPLGNTLSTKTEKGPQHRLFHRHCLMLWILLRYIHHTPSLSLYIYIYIYIERERESYYIILYYIYSNG